MPLSVLAGSLYRRLHTSWELRKYTPYTRAEYFRRLGATVGERCFIVPTSLGADPRSIRIGDHVAIAEGVLILTHDPARWIFRYKPAADDDAGSIVIEDNCLIGQRAILGPNIRIGPNSIVAAGSLVLSDVPPHSIVMGVPARPFGSMDRYREKCEQRWMEQRPPGIEIAPGESWWQSRNFPENRARLREHLLALFHDRLKGEPSHA